MHQQQENKHNKKINKMKKLDPLFMQNAESVAFKAFVTVMKRYKVYFHVLREINVFCNEKTDDVTPTKGTLKMLKDIGIPSLPRNLNFTSLHKKLMAKIEENAIHMGRCDSEYDYLIHCVNTMIQVFIERGFGREGRDNQVIKKLPNFNNLGQEIFNLAAAKLFDGFAPETDAEGCMDDGVPRTEDEVQFVTSVFNKFIQEGMSMREATIRTREALTKYRTNHDGEYDDGDGQIDGSRYYVNVGENCDYDDEYASNNDDDSQVDFFDWAYDD